MSGSGCSRIEVAVDSNHSRCWCTAGGMIILCICNGMHVIESGGGKGNKSISGMSPSCSSSSSSW
jgi:hypothetical protein